MLGSSPLCSLSVVGVSVNCVCVGLGVMYVFDFWPYMVSMAMGYTHILCVLSSCNLNMNIYNLHIKYLHLLNSLTLMIEILLVEPVHLSLITTFHTYG